MIETLDETKCNGCGLCMQVCPSDVFREDPASGRYRIVHGGDCQTCFSCELDCPERAIHVGPLRRARVQAW